MMRYLLLSVLVVCVIGVMIPSVFGESIIKEKDCEIIGKELDSNIKCRLVIQNPEGLSVTINSHNAQYYDQEKNIMYFGHSNNWMHDYVVVEMDNFNIVDQVQCEGITTGTYTKTTTYPCELQIEPNWQINSDALDSYVIINTAVDGDFIQYEEDVIFATAYRSGSYGVCESWVALYDYDWEMIRWLDDYTTASWVGPGSNYSNQCTAVNLENKFVQSNTEIPYIYYILRGNYAYSDSKPGLHVMRGDTFVDVHTYKTDKVDKGGKARQNKIFLDEDKNELYYFLSETIYQIKGMGEIKSTPPPAAAVSEPVAEKVSEPIQKASTECGKNHDYTFVDGMCTKQFDEAKLGAKWRWDFSDTLEDNPKLSIQVKLIDPSGKIIQDRFVASHGKLAIEFPETGMVGDYQLIWQFHSGGKVIKQYRQIIPIVGEEQQSSEGCGEGTVLVNGVCQLAPTQSKTTSMSIEPLYIIIGVVAIGGVIGAIAVAKRGSKTPKPAKQDLDEYEEQYLAKEKPRRKPVEKKETSSSCSNCGTSLKPTAKFCGSCGTPVS